MLIFNADEALARWAGDHLKMEIAKPNTSIGVAHRGKIVGAAVFNNYRPPNIEVTFVTTSPRWASPGAVKAILRYPFCSSAASGSRPSSRLRTSPPGHSSAASVFDWKASIPMCLRRGLPRLTGCC